jgi:lipopolysaccharide export system permease protein
MTVPLRKFDRYALRQFAVTGVFALAAFTAIFLVIDLMENLDDFLDKAAPAGIILTYYVYFIPEIVRLMLPVAVLLSALFTTGRLSTGNELTALKGGGVSLYRFMAPFLIAALLLSGFAAWFGGWVVPFTNQKKFAIARAYFHKYIDYGSRSNICIQDSRDRILTIGVYDDARSTALRVSIQEFDPADPSVMTARYDAFEMRWDDSARAWTLLGGTVRTFAGGRETQSAFREKRLAAVNFSPDDIRKKQQKPDEMDYNDLGAFIDHQQRAGQDVARWLVDYYGKIAFPFANFIVVIFGIPFAAVKRRSGVGVEFGIALAICFLYMIFLKVSQAFGYNGDMDPLLTAWLANLIFLAGGGLTLRMVPK